MLIVVFDKAIERCSVTNRDV